MVPECVEGVSWAVYTRDEGFWKIKRVARNIAPWPDNAETTVLWTDQHSNLFSVLNSNWRDTLLRLIGY